MVFSPLRAGEPHFTFTDCTRTSQPTPRRRAHRQFNFHAILVPDADHLVHAVHAKHLGHRLRGDRAKRRLAPLDHREPLERRLGVEAEARVEVRGDRICGFDSTGGLWQSSGATGIQDSEFKVQKDI
jgi:hypothetical protein